MLKDMILNTTIKEFRVSTEIFNSLEFLDFTAEAMVLNTTIKELRVTLNIGSYGFLNSKQVLLSIFLYLSFCLQGI